jgi:ABC-type multidrug transport system fused ATPase/permease subunit
LRGVTFREGQVMADGEAQSVSIPVTRLIGDLINIPLWKQLLLWAVVFLVVLIISTILSPELRRRLIVNFLRFMVIFWAIYFLAKNYGYLFKGLMPVGELPTQLGKDPNASTALTPVFTPPQVSPALTFLIGLAVALILVGVWWWLNRWWKRRQMLLAMQRPLDDIANIARASLDDLAAGRAWDDVILDSYFRMSRVVEKQRGLARQHAMTPSEFAARLEQAGLPGDAVRRLTRLFESVRYGAHSSTPEEINEAVTCLSAILHDCGESA